MAEYLLKHKLKQAGINGKRVQVSSAGIMANETDVINPNTVAVLAERGIVVKANRKAKQLKKSLVNKNTVLIAMSESHKQWVQNLPSKTYALSDFDGGMDVPDPFGQSLEQYQKVARILDFVLDELLEKIMDNTLLS